MVAPPSSNPPPQVWNQGGYQSHEMSYPAPQAPEHRRDSVEYNNYYPQPQYSQPRSQTPVNDRGYQPGYAQSQSQYQHTNYHQPPTQAHVPSVQQKNHRGTREDLPPLKLTALEPRLPSLNSPSSATSNSGYMGPRSSTAQGALPSPTTYAPPSAQPQPSPYHYQPAAEASHPPAPSSQTSWGYPSMIKASEPAPRHAGQKRSWDRVFSSETHSRERLQNGSRPTQNNYGLDADEDDEEEIDFTKMRMSYRRADGVQITRALPDDLE